MFQMDGLKYFSKAQKQIPEVRALQVPAYLLSKLGVDCALLFLPFFQTFTHLTCLLKCGDIAISCAS
jgi:hypothetical protein